MTDFVSVVSWTDEQEIEFFPSDQSMGTFRWLRFYLTNKNNVFTVVAQDYNTEAHNVYVIIGNVALLKCEIPSFVADFVSVVSWTDEQEIEFFPFDQSMGKLVNN